MTFGPASANALEPFTSSADGPTMPVVHAAPPRSVAGCVPALSATVVPVPSSNAHCPTGVAARAAEAVTAKIAAAASTRALTLFIPLLLVLESAHKRRAWALQTSVGAGC